MIPSNETQVVIRLLKGEMVHCLNCKTGVYIPGGKSLLLTFPNVIASSATTARIEST